MAIPKFDELIPPVLGELAKPGIGTIKWNELEDPIAKKIGLSEEEKATEYDSGNGRIFLYRISWALTYLSIAKLIERPKRGYCKITELGLSMVGDDDKIKAYVKEKIAEHDAQKKAIKKELSSNEDISGLISETTPDEALNQAFQNIRDSVYEDILDTILSKT
jgi:restriction system protein